MEDETSNKQEDKKEGSSASLGSMAKFVAATLRDKVLQETEDEVVALRAQVQRLQDRVQELEAATTVQLVHSITNDDGTTSEKVCFQGTAERRHIFLRTDKVEIHMPRLANTDFALSMLPECYIRVGGMTWDDLKVSTEKRKYCVRRGSATVGVGIRVSPTAFMVLGFANNQQSVAAMDALVGYATEAQVLYDDLDLPLTDALTKFSGCFLSPIGVCMGIEELIMRGLD